MLLILSNSQDVTADYLGDELEKNGIPFVRFDTDTCLTDTQFRFTSESPEVRLAGEWHRPGDFSNVWYRRPERLKHAGLIDTPEAKLILNEWSEAIEGFLAHIPVRCWMNHPAANVAASHKIEQLTTARRLGIPVPETLVTQNAEQLRAFFAAQECRVIVKPLSVGYVERNDGQQDSLIYTSQVTERHLDHLVDLPICPTFFQEYVQKESDVRITVVDDDIHAIELTIKDLHGSQRCDVRRDNMEGVSYRAITLPQEVEAKIRALTQHYSLRFAAIDMAVATDGRWIFFEINPNGQWAWLDLAGVANIARSFVHSFS